MDIFIDELQGVPVAGDDDALPPVVGADLAHSADNIISLPALTFVDGDIHSPEHVLHDGHLLGQFLRHAMPVGLIAVVFQVTEGWAMKVKSHGNSLRLLFLLHPFQNVQETVNGMGIKPLPGGKGLHTKIGTVNNTVAVQDQQLHTFLHLAP